MATFEQGDWGGGIYRGRRAPQGTVYDALNALVDDEGNLFKRGVSAYKSNANAGAALVGLIDTHTLAGPRTLFTGAGAGEVRVLAADDATPVDINAFPWRPFARSAAAGGYVFYPVVASVAGLRGAIAYAGSRRTFYTTGTAGVTAGSDVVTGTGTAFVANVDKGMIFDFGGLLGIVKEVVDNTTLTLLNPWPGATASGAYGLTSTRGVEPSTYITDDMDVYVTSVGASARLLVCAGQRIYPSAPGDPFTFDENQYLELPSDSVIVGADSMEDVGLVFTTRGVWALGNLDFDPVDDAGNVQWQQQQVNKDLLLWGDPGVAAWEGVLVVPAVDDVYLFAPSGEARSISEAIRPLYRAYVKAGYQPGQATVHRGHYVLPVLNGSTLVDVLVCRLDRPYGEAGMRPWTRWAGHAAGVAYAQRVGASTRSPRLLGVSGQRVTDLTGCMDVTSSSGQDADATTPVFRVDTNDDDLGPGIRPNTAEKVRFVYETTGGTPTITVSTATGPVGSSYTAATLKRGGGASDGTDYSAWRVGRKAERVRFRFECTSQVTSLILRRREVTVRLAAQS